ncbi:hypothetical protein AB0O62_02030 [Streptomyces sp. NPDC086779]|uniref:hypothetical protein n=1 Tax=Streptomyces sp. NPDC086779 TaxID=3156670 RepID=UPI003420B666
MGSPEDRAHSYRRFLDAHAHTMNAQILYYYCRRDVEAACGIGQRRARARLIELRDQAWGYYTQTQHEGHAALLGMRLCAPLPVLVAAEELSTALPRFYDPDTRKTLPVDDYQDALDQCTAAKWKFLDAARHDLSYNPRPWQLLRKWRERKHREAAAQA